MSTGMNNEQYLLGKLAEEAAEVAQIALKTQQYGFDAKHPDLAFTNRQGIYAELNDLLAIVDMLNKETFFNFTENPAAQELKIKRVKHYREYSQQLGLTK